MISDALLACAPHVAPATLNAIARVESRHSPLAINVNRGPRIPLPTSAAQAATTARYWISRGYNVDLGLMQVNNRNLARLGYSVEQMFDPCLNIKAGAAILTENYARARRTHGDGQPALLAALSAYNTGSQVRGFSNGYIDRYFDRRPYRVRTTVGSASAPAPSADASAHNIIAFVKETANGRP